MGPGPIFYSGLDESNPYIRRIKSLQFIYIFNNVGLINQTPTRKTRPLQKINQQKWGQAPFSWHNF